MQFLSKVGHGPVSSDFILEVIRVDLHCHLEVTVAQQGRFGIKSTAAQKRHGRYGQSYYRTLIGSRMCSVQWRHPRWHWNTFQGHGRRRCFPHEKLSPVKFMFTTADVNNSVPMFPLHEKPSHVNNFPVRFWPWQRFALSDCSLVGKCRLFYAQL